MWHERLQSSLKYFTENASGTHRLVAFYPPRTIVESWLLSRACSVLFHALSHFSQFIGACADNENWLSICGQQKKTKRKHFNQPNEQGAGRRRVREDLKKRNRIKKRARERERVKGGWERCEEKADSALNDGKASKGFRSACCFLFFFVFSIVIYRCMTLTNKTVSVGSLWALSVVG